MTQELHGVISLGGTVIGGSLYQRGLKGETGDKGDKGDAATVTVGSTTTGAAGTSASVTNSGTQYAAVLDFTIPKGDKGDTGATGDVNTYIAEYGSATYAEIGSALSDGKYVIAQYNNDYYPLIMFSNSSYVFSYIHENICHEVVCDSYSTWTARTHTSVRDVKQNGASVTTSGVALVTTPQSTTTTPKMDGTAAVGSETTWAKGDHVHPSDTTKVDKEVGKGLSANDFTDSLKTKLEGVESGAEVNVQSDWNQSTNTADDYIKNKPDLSVYAPLDSPSLTGTPTAPTATVGTNTTQIATTAFVKTGDDAVKEMIKNTLPTDTASGAIASFEDGSDLFDYLSCIVNIDPVQDLHGYDKPWVGGTGANKWDEQWELGFWGNGVKKASSANIRSKNKFPIAPDTIYYLLIPTNFYYTYYDADGEVLPQSGYDSESRLFKGTPGTITTPNGAYYMTFNLGSGYGTTYNHDIAVNYPSTVTTYSPWENICPITGWTGCEVDVSGVNLFNKDASGILADKYLAIDGTVGSVGGGSSVSDYIEVKGGQTYFASRFVTTSVERYCCWYDEDKTFISSFQTILSPTTITAPNNAKYLRISFYTSQLDYIYINYPSTDHDYHAHNPNSAVYPVSWQTEAGTVYGGTVDIVTGVLTVNGAKDTYDEQASISMDSDLGGYHRFYIGNNNIKKYSDYRTHMSANLCPTINNYANYGGFDGEMAVTGYHITTYPSNYVYIISKTISSVADLKTFLSSNPLEVWYELATPQTYQLDPVQVACLLGQNNVWANCGSIDEVKYKADVQKYIDKKTEELSVAILALS